MVVSRRVELILVAVLVISQIEVHSGGCTKGVVRAGREVVVVLVLEKLVSLASMFAALTLAREARARNLIYMDTRME